MNDAQFLKIQKEYGTPVYVFDTEHLKQRVAQMRTIVGPKVKLCYSIKANPFVIPAMEEVIDHLEVCSPGELTICEKLQVNMQKIIFSGVNKTLEDVKQAVNDRVGIYTAESLLHVKFLQQTAEEEDIVIPVLLRLNAGSQFGMSKEDLLWVIEHRAEYPNLSIEGVHYFAGTQRKKIKEQIAELEMLLEFFKEVKEKQKYELKKLEYGPGLPVPYFEGEEFEDTLQPLKELAPKLQEVAEKTDLTIEMGRFYVAECGHYLSKVVDQKSNKGTNFCIMDGGMNHVTYLGQMMGMKVPKIRHLKFTEDTEEKAWCLCGSLCTTADVMVRKATFSGLSLGDILVWDNIGAYSVTEGIYLFLSRTMPAIILYEGEEQYRLVRPFMESSQWNIPLMNIRND